MKEKEKILFRGSNFLYAGVALFMAFVICYQLKISELKYEIKKNEKEYVLVLDELEKENNLAINGE